jgi:hypothetical protein
LSIDAVHESEMLVSVRPVTATFVGGLGGVRSLGTGVFMSAWTSAALSARL